MTPALLCDLDGTLALNNSGRPWYGDGYEARVYEDDLNEMVNKVVNALYWDGTVSSIVFVSGRAEIGRDETLRWLMDKAGWDIDTDQIELFMRKDGDYRQDQIVKREIYDEHIAPVYSIRLALDDRPEVVALWRSLDIPTWQVGEYR